MNYKDLQLKTEAFVRNYFTSANNEKLVYHNIQHTEHVVRAAIQIADHYQLNEKDYFIVIVAAWFHDVGYFTNTAQHETEGAVKASEFLHEQGMEGGILSH